MTPNARPSRLQIPLRSLPLCLLLCAGVLLSTLALAAEQEIRPFSLDIPVLGFISQSDTSAWSPIWGIPGSAVIGPALDPGFEGRLLAVSPVHGRAVVRQGDEVGLMETEGAVSGVWHALGYRTADDPKVTWSPRGQAMALFEEATRRLTVFADLTEDPNQVADLEVDSVWGAVAGLAVSDDARAVLIATTDAESADLWLFAPGEEARRLFTFQDVASMAFLARSHDAVLAERGTNQVHLVRNVSGSSEMRVLAGARDGIESPVAVEASLDGRTVFVANASGVVASIDTSNESVAVLSCECALKGLFRLRGNAVFRLNDPADGPLFLFDGDADEARIVLVPKRQ